MNEVLKEIKLEVIKNCLRKRGIIVQEIDEMGLENGYEKFLSDRIDPKYLHIRSMTARLARYVYRLLPLKRIRRLIICQ